MDGGGRGRFSHIHFFDERRRIFEFKNNEEEYGERGDANYVTRHSELIKRGSGNVEFRYE